VSRFLFWLAIVVLGAAAAYHLCVIEWLLLPDKRAFNAMKNRTTLPTAQDIDPAATLEALLQPGDDRHRWSQQRAAEVEGFVIRVVDAGAESANCFSLTRVDAHVELALRLDAPANERLIVEVTPPMRDWASQQAMDWSTPALARMLTGQRVRIEGWLLFDDEHDEESENTRPGNPGNWRQTAWELHPVTSIALVR
jgi:hypothetical protein